MVITGTVHRQPQTGLKARRARTLSGMSTSMGLVGMVFTSVGEVPGVASCCLHGVTRHENSE